MIFPLGTTTAPAETTLHAVEVLNQLIHDHKDLQNLSNENTPRPILPASKSTTILAVVAAERQFLWAN